jgi:hypothetical protein
MRTAASKMLATNCIHLSFVNFALHPTSQTKMWCIYVWRFKQLCLGHNSELNTCSYKLFSHNDRYCQLPKYWTFLLNHPVSGRFGVLQRQVWILDYINNYELLKDSGPEMIKMREMECRSSLEKKTTWYNQNMLSVNSKSRKINTIRRINLHGRPEQVRRQW